MSAMQPFPITAVREQFPALGDESIFLDNPAGTQVPDIVIDAVQASMRDSCANLGGHFDQSVRAEALVDLAHARAATLLGAKSADEIAIGSSMTELTFHVSRALARTCVPGDEIVVTSMDHEGNVSPWLIAARDFGLEVRWVAFDEDSWRIEPEAFASALSDRTRVVALNYASNMTGSINDVKALVKLAHEAGALVYVDAVQYAPHGCVDVADLGCDFLACSAYKFFGPHLGVLWGREQVLDGLDADRLRCGPTGPGAKFERGTPQVELLAGLAASVDYFESLGRMLGEKGDARAAIERAYAAATEYEAGLTRQLVNGLLEIRGLSIKGITAGNQMRDRVPTVSFTSANASCDEIAKGLASRGVNAWSGHNYAYAVAQQLGLDMNDGVVRLGIAHYNLASEIEHTLDALEKLCG